MGRKTGDKSQVLLRFDKDLELKKKFEGIRQVCGIQANAEIVRMLINEKYAQLLQEKKIQER
jgi:hypothetical protein